MQYPANAQSAAGVELSRHGINTWEQVEAAIGPLSPLPQAERDRIARLALVANPNRRMLILALNESLATALNSQ